MKLSVIIPVFNEEKNVNPLYRRLKKTLNKISNSHEIIFVDDGSRDDTMIKILKIREKDRKVKYINFARNFGHMAAISAGLKASVAEKVVVMDADLQDPPEVITKLYEKSKEFDVVYAVKFNRKESPTRKFLFESFYKLLNKTSKLDLPLNAGTFSLMDRKIVHLINELPERNKYFSGLRYWVGYRQGSVKYERARRLHGQQASYRRLIRLALDGLLSFSYLPLRLASFFGLIFSGFAFLMIIFILASRIFFGFGIVGWTSTISTVLLIGGVQLITLGVIGEYLSRIYDEVKSRPEYVIARKVGFNTPRVARKK